MTGREKIEAAMSAGGATEIPAVICYEGIYYRDRWKDVTKSPWQAAHSPVIEEQMSWRREAAAAVGHDWYQTAPCLSLEDRKHLRMDVHGDGVYRVDTRNGKAERIPEPQKGGWSGDGRPHSVHPAVEADTREQIDGLLLLPGEFDREKFRQDGRADLAGALLREFGQERCPISHVGSPLWKMYGIWGYEGMMMKVAADPELVEYAARRALEHARRAVKEAAAIGARCIWIEECLTDQISPASFAALNVPLVKELVSAIRREGMKSIYYYCGNPWDRWDAIEAVGADALALEESKKGFRIDMGEVVERSGGRYTVLGNLDAVGVLEKGSEEELRLEIDRQIRAGRRNGSRFIMSTGSPVTPDTPPERVRLYCDMVRELGSAHRC